MGLIERKVLHEQKIQLEKDLETLKYLPALENLIEIKNTDLTKNLTTSISFPILKPNIINLEYNSLKEIQEN